MSPGDPGTSLSQKLGIKEGRRVILIDPPLNYFELLSPLPDGALFCKPDDELVDLIHLFARKRVVLEELLGTFKSRIAKNGTIWVSWPKKAAKVTTNLDENVVRELALERGLVDVKVCSVDETWSGLKLMIRLKDRK